MKTQNEMICDMKTTCCTIVCLTVLGLTTTLGQQSPPLAPVVPPRPASPAPSLGEFSSRPQLLLERAGAPPPAELSLTRFNLDFPGGTPKELVAAIEKATARPLNAIVNDEFANLRLPALKMTNVTVPELFQALVLGSKGSATVGNNTYSTEYGFMTGSSAPPSNDTIWHFYAYKRPPPAKVCRFYSLALYLDRGIGVDDITTAVETGWKMLGETSPPTISFHKDTKLLIAVGEPSKLETIDAVLKALGSQMGGGGIIRPPKPETAAPTPAPAVR